MSAKTEFYACINPSCGHLVAQKLSTCPQCQAAKPLLAGKYTCYDTFKASYSAMLSSFCASAPSSIRLGQGWTVEQLAHLALAEELGNMSDNNPEFLERYESEGLES